MSTFTDYYYRIKATRNGEESGFSVALPAKTLDEAVEAPSSLTGTRSSQFEAILDWTDNADNEIGFILERSLSNDFSVVFAREIAADAVRFVDGSVEPGAGYFYRIKSIRPGSESAYSNIFELANSPETTILSVGQENEMVIYPNPTSGVFSVSSVDHPIEHIRIFNLSGKLIYEDFPSKNQLSIDLDVPNGLYTVFLKNEVTTKTETVVLSK